MIRILASVFLVSAIALFLLLRARPSRRVDLDPPQTAASPQKNPRLRAADAASLPLWLRGLIVSVLLASIALWYLQDGRTALAVARMTHRWQPLIDQVKFTGSSALQALPIKDLPAFCELLQRQIDRDNASQLRALGDCYSAERAFNRAEPVYDRLRRKHPNDPETMLLWAENKLLAHPEAPPQAVITALLHLIATDPDHLIARLLLASAYTHSGNDERAKPLWDALKRDMAPDHRLYPLVEKAAAELERQDRHDAESRAIAPEFHITVDVAQSVFEQLPGRSRLFVFVTTPEKPRPIAAKVLPLARTNQVTLSDRDAVHGQTLAHYRQLEIHATVTANGKATGAVLASATVAVSAHTRKYQLTLQPIHE